MYENVIRGLPWAVRQRITRLRGELLGDGDGAESAEMDSRLLDELYAALEELEGSGGNLREQNAALRETEEALTAERERYRELFDSAPDAYVVTDEQGAICEANAAASALLAVDRSRLMGKPLALFVAKGDRSTLRQELILLPRGGRRQDWEMQIKPRRGAPLPASVSVAAQPAAGGVGTTLRWLVRDVSERTRAAEQARQLEAERIARAEAEAANLAKSEFLAVISHELRTPLTAIIAYAELLDMGVPLPVPAEMRGHANRIEQSAQHMLQLIEQILEFARIEAGREEVYASELDLRDLCAEAAAVVQPLAEKKQLRFELHLPDEPVATVTDRGKLRQVLINLLSNAVKFTGQGRVGLLLDHVDGIARFQVRDTGIGIAPEHVDRVFEPFWQADRGTTDQASGTGLGLAVSYRIAQLLGGDLNVQSTAGQGTTFVLTLPRNE